MAGSVVAMREREAGSWLDMRWRWRRAARRVWSERELRLERRVRIVRSLVSIGGYSSPG
ncbi:hypothetical protein SESBI_06509 [Sesbania bispinosa]|nr:hypothetical protein SESBI_06509 [Sesbania bispinosa]